MHTTVFGVAAIVIPETEYARLTARMELRARFDAIQDRRGVRRPKPNTVERDVEVATFLRERFALAETLAETHEAARKRFGSERTPSPSRVGKFRQHVLAGG